MRFSYLPGILLLSIFFVSCEKSLDESFLSKDAARAIQEASANKFSYGNRALFLKPNSRKNLAYPVKTPRTPGFFKAIPWGLALDSVTGTIDLEESLTGLQYKVFYVSPKGALIDSTPVIIGGIDYEDAIYDMSSSSTIDKISKPIRNANKKLNLLQQANSTNEDEVFDETDLNNDGIKDKNGVDQEYLVVDKKTGAINVKASFDAGIMGSSSPPNGSKKDITLYYRLKDESKKALNKITLRVFYFKRKQDIPQSLIDLINARKELDKRVEAEATPGQTSLLTSDTTTTDPLSLDLYATRRPPLIVIIGQ